QQHSEETDENETKQLSCEQRSDFRNAAKVCEESIQNREDEAPENEADYCQRAKSPGDTCLGFQRSRSHALPLRRKQVNKSRPAALCSLKHPGRPRTRAPRSLP